MNPNQISIKIRIAQEADAPALLDIYRPYILHTAITFEYEVPSISDFESRIKKISSRYPYLVAEENDKIIGYAYASSFKERAAYDWTVETSIYIDERKKSVGAGTALYQNLEERLKLQNVTNLCACIAYPNPQSIAFHEKFGYKTVAHFHQCGYKFNTWHDMIWMEKFIGAHISHPNNFIPSNQIKSL